MATRIQLRRDTSANWTSANPTLSAGEAGYETDTGKLKIGVGGVAWNSLTYVKTALTDTTGDYVATVSGTDGVTISGSGAGAAVTVANSDKGSSQNIFKNVAVSGQSTIVADSNDDTLTIVAGTGVTLTTNATTDTLTITNAGVTSVNDSTGAIVNVALTTGKLSQFASTTSSELAGVVSDETGTGSLVFSASPTFTGTVNAADLTISGNLTVNGTTTTINSATLTVDDKNIELGSVETPSDATADGGGITLKGTTDKTFNWVDATDSWTSSEHIDLANGKVVKINGVQVLSATEYAGNAATVTNGVVTTGSYSDPSWISSLAWSKISSTPTTLSGYGITDAQALDADLTAIAGLTGTSGFLKKTAENTWSLDTSTYLTGNQTITVSGDATGSGTTTIELTLANSGVSADTYGSATAIPVITVDAKGRITGVTTSSVEGLPSQSGNAGKYLTTNGTAASWGTIEEGLNPLLLGGM